MLLNRTNHARKLHFLFYNVTLRSHLNEKVGFKRPTRRYSKNSISCGALLSGTAQWTSGVGWSFDL